MYKNATVSLYVPVSAANGEGDIINTWGYKKTPTPDAPAEVIRADVQPKRLSEDQREVWGISTEAADARVIYFSRATNIKEGNRAYVESDFPGATAGYFDIKTPALWPGHGECILVPVQGE